MPPALVGGLFWKAIRRLQKFLPRYLQYALAVRLQPKVTRVQVFVYKVVVLMFRKGLLTLHLRRKQPPSRGRMENVWYLHYDLNSAALRCEQHVHLQLI